MKRIALSILSLLCCLSIMAQQNPDKEIPKITFPKSADQLKKERYRLLAPTDTLSKPTDINDIITFKLPKQAKSITKEELRALADSVKYRSDYSNYTGKTYQLGSAIIIIRADKGDTPKNFTESWKRGFDYLIGDRSNYRSEIIKINGNEVLVTAYDQASLTYYDFRVVNKAHTATAIGVIEMEQPGKDKCRRILNRLIRSIRFKE